MTRNPVDPDLRARTALSSVIPGVSLICTVFNEEESIGEFLRSVYSMNAIPEEFVIVDGGSTDRTAAVVTEFLKRNPSPMTVRHILRPDCNRRVHRGAIARGRNVAITEARCDIIAATDAGCLLESDWLARIVAPLFAGADAAGGWYIPDARTPIERCIGRIWLVPPQAVDPENFLPSSRSIAFRKPAWAAVGGYPEWTYYAEDTIFNLELRAHGYRPVYVPGALVRWRVPRSVTGFAKLVYRYAFAEGQNRILLSSLLKSGVKVSMSAAFIALSVFVHPAWMAAFVLNLALLASRRHGSGALAAGFLAGLPCAMLLKAIADITYLAGYLLGRLAPASPPRARTGS